MPSLLSAATGPTKRAMREMTIRTDRATMYGIREAGRQVRRVSMSAAPVYAGPRTSISTQRVRFLRGLAATGSGPVEGNKVVAGLLRSSIKPSRHLDKVGHTYLLKVGARGPRVHKYAPKIEALTGFMRAGQSAAVPLAPEIFAKAWARAHAKV